MTYPDDAAVDLKLSLKPEMFERVMLAEKALNDALGPGRTAVAQMLASSLYVVDSGTGEEVDYAYDVFGPREPVTKTEVAAHCFKRTGRRLAGRSGNPVEFTAEQLASFPY